MTTHGWEADTVSVAPFPTRNRASAHSCRRPGTESALRMYAEWAEAQSIWVRILAYRARKDEVSASCDRCSISTLDGLNSSGSAFQ